MSVYLPFFFFFLGEMSPDIVKTKKSELRLYCDLLMEQVHSVKQSISSTHETPDIQVS